jgi:hypothetical protein
MVVSRKVLFVVMAGFALSLLGVLAHAETAPSGPLGLPSVTVLKEKLTLSDDQVKKVETIYEEYKDKAKEVEATGDPARIAAMKGEIVSKIKEHCNATQGKMLDELVREKK